LPDLRDEQRPHEAHALVAEDPLRQSAEQQTAVEDLFEEKLEVPEPMTARIKGRSKNAGACS